MQDEEITIYFDNPGGLDSVNEAVDIQLVGDYVFKMLAMLLIGIWVCACTPYTIIGAIVWMLAMLVITVDATFKLHVWKDTDN